MRKKSVEVRKYMLQKPATVKANMTIYEASHHIIEHKISGLAVVDDDNNLVGMLSELDCLRAIVHGVYNDGDPGSSSRRTDPQPDHRPSICGDIMRRQERPIAEIDPLVKADKNVGMIGHDDGGEGHCRFALAVQD